MTYSWNRRNALCAAGAVGLLGSKPALAVGEPPPGDETHQTAPPPRRRGLYQPNEDR